LIRNHRSLIGLLVVCALGGTLPVVLANEADAAPCVTPNVLTGSNFEVDTNANLAVNGTSPCVDWLDGSAMRASVLTKADKASGSGDDAFGQGTAENDANPTIVNGSIPPNKSDLKTFGVNTEVASGKFLQLFWTRVQNPSGTTNMDFELNKKFCDPTATPTNCANNGKNVVPETPLRSTGDKLITYDLAKGGTVPVISIRTWSGSAWGTASVISGAGGTALGSVNTSTIASGNSGGLGQLDPYTFGEASIDYSALFPAGTACGTFGSAYLKSRSSDSFSAELKDFIGPEHVQITNCSGISTTAVATATLGDPISDTATLTGATTDAGGTITFRLYSDDACTVEINTGLTPVAVNGNGDYNSGNYTPTSTGTYYWIASYSGDPSNSPSAGECGDEGESSVVSKLQPTISTAQTIRPQDSVTITGSNPTGSVTFELFGPADPNCTGTPAYSETVALVGGAAATSNTTFDVTSATAATYKWEVSYSGDTKHEGATATCGSENFTVSIVNG
jgi:hypothetical protein